MQVALTLVVLSLVSVLAHPVSAEEITLFGPMNYTKDSRAPVTFTNNFTSQFTDATLLLACTGVDNGCRGIRAKAVVNGVTLVAGTSFHHHDRAVEIGVYNLGTANTLSVALYGKGEGTVAVQVVKHLLTPEQVMAKLAADLEKGDLPAVTAVFVPSTKNVLLASMDPATMKQLAEILRDAELVESTDTYKVFRIVISDPSGTHRPQFTMNKSSTGEWKIISW